MAAQNSGPVSYTDHMPVVRSKAGSKHQQIFRILLANELPLFFFCVCSFRPFLLLLLVEEGRNGRNKRRKQGTSSVGQACVMLKLVT